MQVIKFVSNLLIVAMLFQSTAGFAASARRGNHVMSTEKFEKMNTGLKQMVKGLTSGRGWVSVANLRTNMKGMLGSKVYKEMDARLAKVPQNAIVTFTVNGSEIKFAAPFESGYVRINNSRTKTFQTADGKFLTLQDMKTGIRDGEFSYRGPNSLLEHVWNIIVPDAQAFPWGIIAGILGGIVIGAVGYKMAVEKNWFGLGEDEEEDTSTTTTSVPIIIQADE